MKTILAFLLLLCAITLVAVALPLQIAGIVCGKLADALGDSAERIEKAVGEWDA